MADIDAFEAAFSSAYRRYLDEAPAGIDPFAQVHAVMAADAARRAIGWWPGRSLARWHPVWIVLAVGLLLIAGLVAYASSHRSATFSSCSAEPSLATAGPVVTGRPPFTARATAMAFDRRAQVIVLVTAGSDGVLQTWTFDVCTNSWAEMHPTTAPARGDIGGQLQITYDPSTDRTILVDAISHAVWAYDLRGDAWSRVASTPEDMLGAPWLAYDSARGRVIVRARIGSGSAAAEYGLWSYDAESRSWAVLPQYGAQPAGAPFGLLGYDQAADVLVWCTSPTTQTQPLQVWRYDLGRGAWSESRAWSRPYLVFGYGPAGTEMTYDEAEARTIVITHGVVAIYDATADRWQYPVFSGSSLRSNTRLDEATVYDPIDRRVVIYGGSYVPSGRFGASPVWSDDVIAVDVAKRTWVELLPVREVHPVP